MAASSSLSFARADLEDVIFLDKDEQGNFVVCNIATTECKALGPGHWSLHLADDAKQGAVVKLQPPASEDDEWLCIVWMTCFGCCII